MDPPRALGGDRNSFLAEPSMAGMPATSNLQPRLMLDPCSSDFALLCPHYTNDNTKHKIEQNERTTQHSLGVTFCFCDCTIERILFLCFDPSTV